MNYSNEDSGMQEVGHDAINAANIPQSKLMDSQFDFHVIQDASKKSYTSGEIKDFSAYFNSRFQKIKAMLVKKQGFKDSYPMKDVGVRDDVVNVIGMVNDIRNTKNNHKIMEIEDETGSITVSNTQ